MKILVTGNPRSGTLSMKNMLRSAGYDVLHERNGKDGTSSCFFFLEARYYPREKLTAKRHMTERGTNEHFDRWNYDVCIHLVRNPLNCIPSMAKVVGTGHQQWLADHGIVTKMRPKITWAAAAWYNTNCEIEAQFDDMKYYRIQIEHAIQQWPKELVKPTALLHQHKGSGTRRAEPLTKERLFEVSSMAQAIIDQARGYGYKL